MSYIDEESQKEDATLIDDNSIDELDGLNENIDEIEEDLV